MLYLGPYLVRGRYRSRTQPSSSATWFLSLNITTSAICHKRKTQKANWWVGGWLNTQPSSSTTSFLTSNITRSAISHKEKTQKANWLGWVGGWLNSSGTGRGSSVGGGAGACRHFRFLGNWGGCHSRHYGCCSEGCGCVSSTCHLGSRGWVSIRHWSSSRCRSRHSHRGCSHGAGRGRCGFDLLFKTRVGAGSSLHNVRQLVALRCITRRGVILEHSQKQSI